MADFDAAARAIESFLAALGHPVDTDPELAETPARVAEAFHNDLLSGYREDPKAILSEHCASDAKGLVILTGIHTTAVCPHHLLPATGVSHVAYRPSTNVVGLGALARLVNCYARRLILQEDLAQKVVGALVEHLGAQSAGCVIDLAPTCMIARGERQVGARAIATAFAGNDDPELRSALLNR